MSSPRARAATGLGTIALGMTLAACSAPGTSETTRPIETADAAGDYADGTYEARGWYGGLPSHHDVTLTIADGAVAQVDITTPAEDS